MANCEHLPACALIQFLAPRSGTARLNHPEELPGGPGPSTVAWRTCSHRPPRSPSMPTAAPTAIATGPSAA